jgi:L-2-hydroxycarboxylate dehydrogenase (NAD+)
VKGTAALAPIGGIGEDTGGYKGYGFATVVELLSTAFSGNAFLKDLGGKDADGKDIPIPIGHSFMAIDIECFTDLETFKKQAGDVLRVLRASKKTPGAERIYTCGEKEYLAWQERKDKGVPINESVQREMLAMRDELGLSFRFPFETA